VRISRKRIREIIREELSNFDFGPECPRCCGYGTADGKPSGTWARDFGAGDPGPCPECGGTGELDVEEEEL